MLGVIIIWNQSEQSATVTEPTENTGMETSAYFTKNTIQSFQTALLLGDMERLWGAWT